MPRLQQTDQPCAGFVFIVDKWRACDTFRVRLTNEVEEMNSIHEDRLKKRSAEINKERLMAAITNYCHETKGIFPKNTDAVWLTDLGANVPIEIIQMHAKELGYINGYRWGVEYPTNGEKPDLPDDVVVYARNYGDECGKGAFVKEFYWPYYRKFKVVDDRYKPVDTSYLVSEIPESKSNAESVSDWYDYEAKKAVALPPVGANIEGYWHEDTHPKWNKAVVLYSSAEHLILRFADGEENYYHATDLEKHSAKLRPLDHNRKAEAEKKRVVDAAYDEAIKAGCVDFGQWLSVIYDAGFLRMPAE